MNEFTSTKPVDLAHLSQYTGGDARLDAEVLQLFVRQTEESIQRLDLLLDTGNTKAWREAAHSLKGAAGGVGAFVVAEMAGRAESADPGADRSKAAECLVRLRESCDVAREFIAAYLKS